MNQRTQLFHTSGEIPTILTIDVIAPNMSFEVEIRLEARSYRKIDVDKAVGLSKQESRYD